ncbi:tetratricopeptide repeat protein [Streptomyces sp. TLI_185]|uniref:tetratricopeptide repeat protein n=1 Tax=Streptomyces sp. TLI_185 TaxID=2485151 RepID=UPI000FB3B605|nr:tetratricopeptide repeat protein [Streptomyces sp. TLI_185]RPF36357.1 tetratricopeptide (TPR) repeat protein [Streptomyces sp. TLI_185]
MVVPKVRGGTGDGAMGDQYGGDHQDFRGGEFNGPFYAKAEYHEHGPAPTALDSLPPRVAGFTGRESELGQLLGALDPDGRETPEAVLVAAVSGLGGIGKTALAVEAAHAACERGWFPGGVLFVNLHGYDDDLITAEQALEALLRALGIDPEYIPPGADARAALYRSALAKRGRERGAVLVLSDNASSAEQVRPLLPGGKWHRLIATSRNRLPQLGARLLSLGELPGKEAFDLLDRALRIADPADRRVADAREAVSELASCCGHLPLALQIAAARLVLDRDKPVAELVAELTELSDRLAHLDDGERSVRAAFDLSYRRLPPEQARLLRLLALAPGPEATTDVVAVLTGADNAPTRVLNALSRAHLVEQGSGRGRWRLHDLVRVYGAGVVAQDAGLREEGAAARDRVLGYYLRRADAADDRLRWLPGMPVPELFEDRGQALAWLDGERQGLVAAVQWAPGERNAEAVSRLASRLSTYLRWRRYLDDWISVGRAARDAAHQRGDGLAEAIASHNLGIALREAGRAEEAVDAHAQARDLFRATGDVRREAAAWNSMGSALREAGRVEEALDAYIRARDLTQAAGDSQGEAGAWTNLGAALQDAGRADEAVDAHTRALVLHQAAGNRHAEGGVWNNLGNALRLAGRVAEAIEAYGKDLEICEEFEDWYGAAVTLGNLGATHEEADQPAEARINYLKAADAYIRSGDAAKADQARGWADRLP